MNVRSAPGLMYNWGVAKKKNKTRRHTAEIARDVVEKVIAEKLSGAPLDVPQPEAPDTRNQAAVGLGRLGGLKGGRARAKALSKTRRAEIAKKAAKTRWSRKKPI